MNKELTIHYSRLVSFFIAFGLFVIFIHHPYPLRLISFATLIFIALLIGRERNLLTVFFGNPSFNFKIVTWTIFTLGVSFISAVILRNEADFSYTPSTLTWFAPVAILIGCMEELLFRGWLQSQFQGKLSWIGIPISAAAHAGYKSLLFISPYLIYSIDPWHLFTITFIAGLFLGISRVISGSVWPALLAHALFDILIYGDQAIPWWVF